ncbi:MAG: hypothetical protein KKG75_00880 [Nanoarchaeota archaeon]|nr:hypothetical protein [Nanoarchaeota archaeon]
MKKLLFLLLITLIPSTLAVTLQKDQVTNYNGHDITVTGFQEDKVLIRVDDSSNIISEGQQKEISGVKITVTEIFFADDLSTVDIDLSLSYTCGDATCDNFENYETCCTDCGCDQLTTQKCVENICITPECTSDTNCNDNNELTEDYCEDYKCKFRKIRCETNLDCNDNDPDTDDTCNSGNCLNILNYVCKLDEDCEDSNPCTTESCVNKDCVYTTDPDCDYEPPEKEETTNNNETIEKKGFLSRLFSWLANLF